MTTSPSDTATTARGVGSYVSFQPADGPGIRPTPYSTLMSVNPSTYDSIKDTVNISQPHGVGYVWNTMLWEVYWNLIAKYGYNPNVYADWFTGGNNLAIQLVTDGMKFQPCGPGFVDGRDAILTADRALTGGANQCEIWRGFAKRGLGTGAVQGLSTSRTDNSQDFTVPATCSATAGSFRPPIKAAPTLNERDAGDTVPVKYSITGLAPGQDVTLVSEPVGCDDLRSTAAPTPIQTTGNPTKKGNEFQVNWVTDPAWAGDVPPADAPDRGSEQLGGVLPLRLGSPLAMGERRVAALPLLLLHWAPFGALAQLGERRVCNAEVAGSIPARSTTAQVRNLQEQISDALRPLKLRGSSRGLVRQGRSLRLGPPRQPGSSRGPAGGLRGRRLRVVAELSPRLLDREALVVVEEPEPAPVQRRRALRADGARDRLHDHGGGLGDRSGHLPRRRRHAEIVGDEASRTRGSSCSDRP